MRAVAVAVALGVLLGAVQARAQRAPAVCMSDSELRDVLLSVYTFGLAQTAGICVRRYPQLKQQATVAIGTFEKSYGKELDALDKRTIAVFERLYPGRGAAMRDKNDRSANDDALRSVEAYSRDQCTAAVTGLNAMATAQDWKTIAQGGPVGAVWETERAKVAKCK
ncbi:MAG: hypothetical protein U1F33_10395 [Alphaproteobacteria bacterium]